MHRKYERSGAVHKGEGMGSNAQAKVCGPCPLLPSAAFFECVIPVFVLVPAARLHVQDCMCCFRMFLETVLQF